MDTDRERPALDAEAIRALVIKPTGEWRRFDVVEQTGSTNADLLARAHAGDDIRGAVLAAEYQSAGRGRHGRVWSAPARSQIAVSVGIDVAGVRSDAWGWLPLATGVAVVDAVRDVTGIQAGLKWPNDVLVDGGKLAGILAEVAAAQSVIVIGLGLNVTLTAEEAPDPVATSLTMLGAPDVDRNVLLANLLGKLSARLGDWRTGRSLVADYCERSITIGRSVRASLPGDQQIVGVATGIDDSGRLVMATDGGPVTVAAGDITHLRPVD